MSRRRLRWVYLMTLPVASVLTVFACAFPDVRFGEVVDDSGPDGTSDDALGAPADGGAVNLDGPPGDEVEASIREDGQARIDAGAECPGTACDCDNDGYQAMGEECNGDDCDDRDPLVHPNQLYIGEPPEPPNNGDWDCSGDIEKQYIYNLNCGLIGGTGAGFKDDPNCGVVSNYFECTGLLGGSRQAGTRRQGCK